MSREEQDIKYLELQKMYQDNLSIWEGKGFFNLETKFKQAKKDYLKLIKEAQSLSVKQIISKGQMYDIFPFEAEQHGYKYNGRIIPEVIVHNECYIHHFDANDRLILKENMSSFLQKPAYFSLYYYTDTTIEYIYGDNNGIYRYQIFDLSEDSKFIGNMVYATMGKNYETYYYEGDLIVRSERHSIEFNRKPQFDGFYQYDYLYDRQGKLSQIFCNYPFGGKEIKYSTQKVNYKKLEQRIFDEMRNSLCEFLSEHKDEKFTRFGLDCNTPDNLFLCMDDTDDDKILYSLADWQHLELAMIDLVDFPLDDQQNEKLLASIAKALVNLVSLDEFKSLFEISNFKIVFLDHQGEVKESYPSVKKILFDEMYC